MYLTLIKMALLAPDVEWPKKRSVLEVPSLQLIQKFYVEDNKNDKVLTAYWHYISFIHKLTFLVSPF